MTDRRWSALDKNLVKATDRIEKALSRERYIH